MSYALLKLTTTSGWLFVSTRKPTGSCSSDWTALKESQEEQIRVRHSHRRTRVASPAGNDSTCECTESALAKAHDEPTALFSAADRSGNTVQFKEKYGVTQCDDELLNVADEEMSAQSHVESFQESLSNGPHALAHDSSHTEEEHQSNQRPEPARQFPSHLGSTLSLATKRRFTGSMPKDTEQLRIKDSIMSNIWLRAKLRQLCRSLYSHLTLQTLTEFPNVLLSGKNFRTSERCPFIVPRWDTAYVTSSSCATSRFD